MQTEPSARRQPTGGDPIVAYATAIAVVGLVTAVGLLLRSSLNTIDMAMLFLLGVVVVAGRARQGAALFASVLSIAAFDFVFVPPAYTFDVHDAAYVPTFGVMLVVAIVMSRLTARVRRQAAEAEARTRRTVTRSALNLELAGAGTREHVVAIAARHIGEAAGGDATIHVAGDLDAAVEGAADPEADSLVDPAAHGALTWAHEHGQLAGSGTDYCGDAEVLAVPLRSGAHSLGVAVVQPGPDGALLPVPDAPLLMALGEQTAVALERTLLMARHEAARVEVEGERLRTALLSSLSHDLRTPLASIEGAASSLLHDGAALPAEVQRDLIEAVLEESRRMTRLVANLLDMVRVEAGTLALRKQWQPLEETVGVALVRLEDRLAPYPVEVDLPPDLPLVPLDELLIEQVFINLLENAARYCPAGTPITVAAEREDDGVVVSVADRGPGIPAEAGETVFEKFYRGLRAEGVDAAGGAGLGLTICRGILAAHGGRIWVEPTPGGGATFRFRLPLEGPPLPSVPAHH